jgi:hypothetical protein
MRNLIISLIALALVLSGICVRVLFAEEQSKQNDLVLELNKALTFEEFENAVFTIQEKRSELITSLIRMLRNEYDKEKKIRICYLLGEYRATEAIYDLAKIINLEAEVTNKKSEEPRWYKYPAQEALIKCGYRSIPYMITNIESIDDKLIRELSVQVIWQGIGEGLTPVTDGKEYARMIIEKRMNQESDTSKKARLKLAIDYLKPTTTSSSQAK